MRENTREFSNSVRQFAKWNNQNLFRVMMKDEFLRSCDIKEVSSVKVHRMSYLLRQARCGVRTFMCEEQSEWIMRNYFVAMLWAINSSEIVTWRILQNVKIHSMWNSHAMGAHQNFKLCVCVRIVRWNSASFFRFSGSVQVYSSSQIVKH